MKIWVVLVLCASALSLPVEDRKVTLEELLKKVLSAHPLENDIALNKQNNEISALKEGNKTQATLPKEDGSSLNKNPGEEGFHNNGILSSDVEVKEEQTTETPMEEGATTQTAEANPELISPEISIPEDKIEEDPVATAEERDKIFDPSIQDTDAHKPEAEVMHVATSDTQVGNEDNVAEEEQLKNTDTDGAIDVAPIPDEEYTQEEQFKETVDPKTYLELPKGEIYGTQDYPVEVDFAPTDEEIFNQDMATDELGFDENIPVSRVPLDKQVIPEDEITKTPDLYEDEIMPDQTSKASPVESTPESALLDNPFLQPSDTLPNEPDLFENMATEEKSPESDFTVDYTLVDEDPEETELVVDEKITDPQETDSILPASDVMTPLSDNYDGDMAEELPSDKLNPELFRRVENPELWESHLPDDFTPPSSFNEDQANPSQDDMVTQPEDYDGKNDDTSYDTVFYDTEAIDNVDEPNQEEDQFFDNQSDPSLSLDNPEDNSFVLDSEADQQENTPYDETVIDESTFDQPIPEENPGNFPDESIAQTSENIGNDPYDPLTDEIMKVDQVEQMPENENPVILDDSFVIDSDADQQGNTPYDRTLIDESTFDQPIPEENPGSFPDESIPQTSENIGNDPYDPLTDEIIKEDQVEQMPENENPVMVDDSFVIDSDADQQENTPYDETLIDESTFDQPIPEENPGNFPDESIPQTSENIGNDPYDPLTDEIIKEDQVEQMPENENPVMVDESFNDAGSNMEGLDQDYTAGEDTFPDNTEYDSDYIIYETHPEYIRNEFVSEADLYGEGDMEDMPHESGVIEETPETMLDEPYIGENQGDVPYEPEYVETAHYTSDPHSDNIYFANGLPRRELSESSFYNSNERNPHADPYGHQFLPNVNDYEEAYQPMDNDGSQTDIPYNPTEDAIHDSNVESPVEQGVGGEKEEETPLTPNTPEESFVAAEPEEKEHLMPRDMSQTEGENESNGRSEDTVSMNEQNISPQLEESEPFPVYDDTYSYPYSFLMKNYQPLFYPYPVQYPFFENPMAKNDRQSVIIILDPTDAESASGPETPTEVVKHEGTDKAKQNSTTSTSSPVNKVAVQDSETPVIEETEVPSSDVSFQPDLEIPYPSEEQQFSSGDEVGPRPHFTWFPILEQNQPELGRPGSVAHNEYEYVIIDPEQNEARDSSQQYPTQYLDMAEAPQYYQNGNGELNREDTGYENYDPNPYNTRREVYDSYPIDAFDRYYYYY